MTLKQISLVWGMVAPSTDLPPARRLWSIVFDDHPVNQSCAALVFVRHVRSRACPELPIMLVEALYRFSFSFSINLGDGQA